MRSAEQYGEALAAFYQLGDADISAGHSLAQAAVAAPKGVIALLPALKFHGLTTQLPHEVWMLMPSKAWAPTSPPGELSPAT